MEAATDEHPEAQQAAPPPRLRERYEQRGPPALTEKFGYSTPMQAPRLVKITLNMGVGEAKQTTPMLEAATEQLATIAGQQPERPPRPQVDRHLQAPRGDAGRRLGDPARRADVGVPRPPDLDRDPADPRLPRPQPALLRRPRQLLDGRPRAADLPRDRLRLDRRGPRPRRHDHDHGRDRRGGLRAAARARHAVRPGGPPRAEADRGRRGRGGARKEEARLRAEAEQAALEQLKEENPEAYAKPERPRRARRARKARARRAARPKTRATRDPRRSRWLRLHRGSSRAQAEVQDPRLQPLPPLRPPARRTTASSASAGSACARPPTRATSPA